MNFQLLFVLGLSLSLSAAASPVSKANESLFWRFNLKLMSLNKLLEEFQKLETSIKFFGNIQVKGCPEGWSYFNNRCLAVYFCPRASCSIEQSREYCKSKGASLAKVLSKAEDEFLFVFGKGLGGPVAIDGTDEGHEGSWEWSDGSKMDNSTYTNWRNGYPQKSETNNCVYISFGNSFWHDYPCSKLFAFAYACEAAVGISSYKKMQ